MDRAIIMHAAATLVVVMAAGCHNAGPARNGTPPDNAAIKVNQLGYPPGAVKTAIVPAGHGDLFKVVNPEGRVAYSGRLSEPEQWPYSGERVQQAGFSDFTRPGRYRVRVGDTIESAEFAISGQIYSPLNAAVLKAFYYNRAGIELDSRHAGPWERRAGHTGATGVVHASAATERRPEGTSIDSSGGWYDAGDYNQYIVNSGIATYTLLAAWEQFPGFYNNQKINIPESGNGLPDILNEARWNLRWMLTMQDPGDGGVYHKLTEKQFPDDDVLPHQNNATRYVVQKSTSAALDFAAALAASARVFAAFDEPLPGFSQRCLKAAEAAWQWARENPDVPYVQPDDIETGTYAPEEEDFLDEFLWAAAELYLATGEERYLHALRELPPRGGMPHWEWVAPLAWMSLSEHGERVPADVRELARERVLEIADVLLAEQQRSAYAVPMGASVEPTYGGLYLQSFDWGSNGNAANQAMILIQAYRISANPGYLHAAQANLDYLLGRNATGYSFVTGFGEYASRAPHHRPSMGGRVAAPVPGFLVGGPHAAQQDAWYCERKGVSYPSRMPALSYIDHACSYATNEIAINWNAPLVYVSGALQYYHQESDRDRRAVRKSD